MARRLLTHALLIAGLDLRRRVRDRSLLIQAVLAPIALGVIVGVSFAGGVSVSATIGVADADGSALSRQIASSLVHGVAGSPEGGASLDFRAVDAGAARAQVDSGRVDAAVVLPAGFGEAVASGGPVVLQVVGAAGHPLPESVAKAVAESISARVASTRLAVATTTLVARQQGIPVDVTLVSRQAQDLPGLLAAQPRDVQSHFSVIGYFAPAMAMLFLFFTMGAGARSIITERHDGTLPRIRAAPVSNSSVLVGKTLGVLVLGLVSLATVWAVTALVFRVDWGDPMGVGAVLAAVVVAIAGLSLLLTGLARTENQAGALTTIVALVLAVLGGSFFFNVGGVVATMKAFTPNGRALTALTELSAGEGSLATVAPTVLILLATGLVAGSVGVLTLRSKVSA